MLKIIAIGITPRIDEVEHELMQEWLDGTHPMSSKRTYYDSGTPRKSKLVDVDQSGAGPNEIAREDGDRSSMDNVSSGYNRGPEPGGRADDETGPGNTSQPPETDAKQIERMFMTEDQVNNFLFRNEESNKLDNSRSHLFNVFQGNNYGPAPRSRTWQRTFN